MTITVTPRFSLTQWNANADVVMREQITDAFANIDSLAAQCLTGTYASMPAPGIGNRFYYATDYQDGLVFFDTGSAWTEVLAKVDQDFTSTTRPVPGRDGRYVYESDQDRLFRDNGSKWVEVITSTLMPAGVIMPSLVATQPTGWLLCDGSAYGSSVYPDLFAAIGYRFGGSGGTFNVPNLSGALIIGADTPAAAGTSISITATAGASDVANAVNVNWLIKVNN